MTAPNLEASKYYIVVPEAATNYVYNPRHDLPEGITNFTASGTLVAVEHSDTYQRRGAYSCKVTPTTGVDSSVVYVSAPVADTLQYTFSVDVLGYAGQSMALYITQADSPFALLGSKTFTATGYWQRPSLTITATATESVLLFVTRPSVASVEPFYVDGWQFEQNDEATTFFCGDTQGFGSKEIEFGWQGAPRQSYSYRTDRTRAGGRLLDISDYAKVVNAYGLGMGDYTQIMTKLASGGAMYQTHIRNERNFHLMLAYEGANQGEMQANRAVILNACRPDYLEDQPMIIRYQGVTSAGADATNPIDIVCIPQPSQQDTPDNPRSQKTILSFTVPDGLLTGAFSEGAGVGYSYLVTDANYIIKRDKNGFWTALGTGLNGVVRCMAEAPNGDIYVGGTFTNAGGVAEADYIAKWDGTSWSAVGDPAFVDDGGGIKVYDMAFAPNGDLYVGGKFLNAGGVAEADYIAKWDGTSWSAVGDPAFADPGLGNIYLYSLEFDSNGDLYVGGVFANAGGDADADYLAKWNGSTWSAVGNHGSGASLDLIATMKFAPNGDLYIGGYFTNLAGVAEADYIAKWDGSAWSAVGDPAFADPGAGISVHGLEFASNGDLFVGGIFLNAGGVANADYISKWDGSAWSALGTGTNGFVRDMVFYNDEMLICGNFKVAGGLSLPDRVAAWKNGTWNTLDIDLPGTNTLYSLLKTRSGNLYIGGDFTGTALVPAVETTASVSTANVYPSLQIVGPGVLQSIKNYRTGKSIQFDGLTLLAGEVLDMHLDPTNIKMTSSWRGNCLRYVIPGSDHGSFYLEPGTNYISILMPTGTDGDTSVTLEWTPRYWSIEGAKYV